MYERDRRIDEWTTVYNDDDDEDDDDDDDDNVSVNDDTIMCI